MTDSAGPDPRDLTARASPPAHEAEGFANQHWAKQLVAIERLMDKSKLACWKAAAETPQTGRIIDLQVHWEDDGGSRLQLSSYLDPAHNENLNRLFDLYSAHAITVRLWYLVPEKIDRCPGLCIRVCTGATIRARVCVITA